MFMKYLNIINKYWYIYSQFEHRDYKLIGPDYEILNYLSRSEGANQYSICEHFLFDKGAVAKSAARLEENGYIKREINVKNKREKNVFLTDAGKELVCNLKKSIDRWDRSCLEGLSDEEIEQFLKLFKKVSDNARKNIDIYRRNRL